jgi:hypothetical protein
MSIEGEFETPEDLAAATEAGSAALSLTLKLSKYGVPVVIEAPELSLEAIASATAAAAQGLSDTNVDCPSYLDFFITSAGDFDLPVVTSYQWLGSFVDSTGQSPQPESMFADIYDHSSTNTNTRADPDSHGIAAEHRAGVRPRIPLSCLH